ncbi:MAG: hypothetical protein AABX96_05295 [Nanoarchaeota archaeon]
MKTSNNGGHMLKMALACIIPLLLIILLPLFGLPKGWSSGLAIGLMILLHFWMMKDHLGHSSHQSEKKINKTFL